MNSDIRLQITWYSNTKRWQLQDRLGAEGCLAFIDLLIYTAMNKPKGHLTKMNDQAVERAAQWTGEDGKLVDTLTDLGFLEQKAGYHVIHEWNIHNTYASKAPERSKKARKGGYAKRDNSAKKKIKQNSKPKQAVLKLDLSAAPSPSPSPSPNPSPKPKKKTPPDGVPKFNQVGVFTDIYRELFDPTFKPHGPVIGQIQKVFKHVEENQDEFRKRIHHWLSDPWVLANRPPVSHLYNNIEKYKNPVEVSSGTFKGFD